MEKTIKKIGVLGGSFNPPHNDHIRIAEYIRNRLDLDLFLIVPNALPPHKDTCHVEFSHRRRMLQILTEKHSALQISDLEKDPNVPHYTIDLIDKIKSEYPQSAVFFCMGMDSLIYLDKWRNGLDITDKCNIVVIGRKGYSVDDSNPEVKDYLKTHAVYESDSAFSEKLNEEKGNCFLLKECFNDVSSSKIRQEFEEYYKTAEQHMDLAEYADKFPYSLTYLDRGIIEYIVKNSLYRKRES